MRHWHLAYSLAATALFAAAGCAPAAYTQTPAFKGRVVGLDGRPVPGAVVEASRKPDTPGRPFKLEVRSDANGAFAYDGGPRRWALWIAMADVFPETLQVVARTNGTASDVRELEYQTEAYILGLGKPRVHDVGELRVLTFAPSR